MKILNNFVKLKKGIKRLLIVLSIVVAFLAGGLMTSFDEEWVLVSIIICLPPTWLAIFVGLWVYAGFEEN